MKQVAQEIRTGSPAVTDVPEPPVEDGGVVVRNAASLISAGTERTLIEFAGKSMMGKARERPDLVRQVLDKVRRDGLAATARTVLSRLDQPVPLGYSCAGLVEQVGRGAGEFSPGDRVACAGMGYASHAEKVFVPKNLTAAIPAAVSFEDAAYVTLGSISLHGVRVADVRLGESVAVIGLGLLGQLAVQMLVAAGCRVIGVDLDESKVQLARELGAAAVTRSNDVVGFVEEFTGGAGVDAVVVTAATDSNDPTELAGAIARDRAVVSMVGAVKMDVPRKVYYEKELQLRLSRSYGPGRYDPSYEEGGHDYPIGYVRWTERRNMEEFLRLVAVGDVTPARLTTHRFPIEGADRAYEVVLGEAREPFLGVLLTYPRAPDSEPLRTVGLAPRPSLPDGVGVGFIGAGNFARSVLLPRFRKAPDSSFVGVATTNGLTARSAGEKFGFRYCTTDVDELLADDAIHAVVIATRHGAHAPLAARALRAGKAVFVEKPLAIDEAGLGEVVDAQAETGGLLTVGFNRRFSPLVDEIRAAFRTDAPLAVTYRVNAGAIPPDSWVHDPEQGGGRIIGEVCHFVDLIQHLTGEEPVEVFAQGLGGRTAELHDTVTITLRLTGGAIASIDYFATGDPSHPKEYLEVYGGGTVAVLDDFRRLTVRHDGKRERTRRFSQQKGFDQEIEAFVAAVRTGGNPPIPISSLAATTRATFAIEESLRTGAPVSVDG